MPFSSQFLSPFSINALAAGIEAGPGGKPDDITVILLQFIFSIYHLNHANLPPPSVALNLIRFSTHYFNLFCLGVASHRLPVIYSHLEGKQPGVDLSRRSLSSPCLLLHASKDQSKYKEEGGKIVFINLRPRRRKGKKTQPRPILGMQQDTRCFFAQLRIFPPTIIFPTWILERVLPPLVLVVVKSIF